MEDLRRQEVRELARLTAQLDSAQQIFFQAEYGRHRRNPTTALLLCTLLGGFGAHYFYFGRHRAGVTRLLFCWTLIPAVLALFDAHTMSARTLRYNASLANELLLAIKGAVDEQAALPRTIVATRPRAQLPAEERVAIAAPTAEPAERILMDATWAEHDPAAFAGADTSVAAAHEGYAPLVAAGAALGGVAVMAQAIDAGSSHHADGAGDAYADGGMLAVADTATNADVAANTAEASDGAYVPQWPNALAQPVWPAENAADAADVSRDQPIWPVPAALLVDPGPATAYAAQASGDDAYARYTAPAAAAGAASDHGLDHYAWDSFAAAAAAEEYPSTPFGAGPAFAEEPAREVYTDFGSAAEPAIPLGTVAPEAELTAPAGADQREPVFLYQVAAGPRREAVHLGPIEPAEFAGERALGDEDVAFPWAARLPVSSSGQQPTPAALAPASMPAAPAADRNAGDHMAIAALGSALAFGLADLLRDHSRPTRPLTQPRGAQTMPVYDLPRQPAAEVDLPDASNEPPATPSWLLDGPPAAPKPLDAGLALGAVGMAGGLAAGAGYGRFADQGGYAGSDGFATRAGGRGPWSGPLPPAREPDDATSPALQPAPALAAVSAVPAPTARRRVVQRVIVRKMAVLDGQVVAESSVERQVAVVADEQEMAQRIERATLDASREALNYLLMQAPEEARPSIRRQLNDVQASLN